jgi:hypothetical protein
MRLGKRLMRRPMVWLALGTALLVTAGAAAQIAAQSDDSDALARTITEQRVQSGELVPRHDQVEHQLKALTPEQMIDLTGTYESEIRAALEHAETVRVSAYHSKDIIRMTCIEDKLLQMKAVLSIVEPRFITIHLVKHDLFRMRAQFSLIQQAHERVDELTKAIEVCMGDILDVVTAGNIDQEKPAPANEVDPTRPAETRNGGSSPDDRPPAASTWQ